MSKSYSINLAKEKDKRFFDKFLQWALTIGRLIIILTESIALLTFLYRFSLDRQLIDLHDRIVQKQAIVKLLKGNEDKFRDLQNRLTILDTLSNSSSTTTKVFDDLIISLPKDMDVNNLTLSNDYIKIEVKARSITTIGAFVKSLRDNPNVASVSLDRIENRTSNATITAGITANLKTNLKKSKT
ncbi:MAG: PilN domain-containing protein [bacterium]|nr:PilN domain-containing protein [bacterium]